MNDQFSPTMFDAVDPELFTKAHAGDESLLVVFYMGVVRNDARSVAEARLICDDVECIRIIVPGDRNNINDRPASAYDKQRFGKQYAMFKQGLKEDDQLSGTRLTDWPYLSRAQCEELRYLGIKTVEQVAEVRDDVLGRVPGLGTLKQNAQMWLGKTKGSAEAARIVRELEEAKGRIEVMERALRDQGERYEQLQRERAKE